WALDAHLSLGDAAYAVVANQPVHRAEVALTDRVHQLIEVQCVTVEDVRRDLAHHAGVQLVAGGRQVAVESAALNGRSGLASDGHGVCGGAVVDAQHPNRVWDN